MATRGIPESAICPTQQLPPLPVQLGCVIVGIAQDALAHGMWM
jgi:hypothetical protein